MNKLGLIAMAAAMTAGTLSAEIQINKNLSVAGHIVADYMSTSKDVVALPSEDTAGFNVSEAELDLNLGFGNGLSAGLDLTSQAMGATGRDDLSIEQAYMNLAFNSQLSLNIGKFDTVVGLDALETKDNFLPTDSLTFRLEPTQHTGLGLIFDNGQYNFAAIISNEISPVANGNNDDSLSFTLHGGIVGQSWSANANFATGDQGDNSKLPAPNTGTKGTATTAASEVDTTLLTLDAQWSNYGWTASAEYVSLDKDTSGETTAWSLLGDYRFNELVNVSLRLGSSEKEVGAVTTETDQITLGVGFAIHPNWTAKVEYNTEDMGAVGGVGDMDSITLQSITHF